MKNIALPETQKITLRWLYETVPISWMWASVAALFVVFGGVLAIGMELGKANNAGISVAELRARMDELDSLRSEIVNLQNAKARLKAEISVLEIQMRTSQMAPEEMQEDLRGNWSRSVD